MCLFCALFALIFWPLLLAKPASRQEEEGEQGVQRRGFQKILRRKKHALFVERDPLGLWKAHGLRLCRPATETVLGLQPEIGEKSKNKFENGIPQKMGENVPPPPQKKGK